MGEAPGPEDRRSNIVTEDAPIALITKEIPRLWRSVSQKPWRRPNRY